MGSTLDWISLSFSQGLGITGLWRLVNYFKEPGAVLDASHDQLLKVRGVKESQISGLQLQQELRLRAEKELNCLESFGGSAVSFSDPEYPSLLKQLPDPPAVLYLIGNKNLLSRRSVAMVGSRAATIYGRRTAKTLACNLTGASLTVVSGLALGIDTEAHKGALQGVGKTIAVLGCGLDVVYPRSNAQLFREIARSGLIISEYPLTTKPEGFRFPARNRIIAGLAQGVVVVEAARKSGSLITAQIGLDLGREVFAVPGQIDSHKSEGTHWLLQQGAALVQSVDDIVAEFPSPVQSSSDGEKTEQENNPDIEPDAITLLDYIEPYPMARESLLVQSGFTPARLSELLLVLELEGLIEQVPGDKLRKISK